MLTLRIIRSSHYTVSFHFVEEGRETYNIPDTVERRHDTDEELSLLAHPIFDIRGIRKTYHDPSQRLTMDDKPTGNQQPHSKQNGDNRQPIPPRPPKREQKANPQDDTSNLAGDNIEPRENQQRPDNRRSQVSSRQSDRADSALHVRDAALVRIEGYGFDSSTGAAGSYRMAKFVKGDD